MRQLELSQLFSKQTLYLFCHGPKEKQTKKSRYKKCQHFLNIEICAKHRSAGMALTNYEDHSAQQNL